MGQQVWPKQSRTKVGRFTSIKSRIMAALRWFMLRLAIISVFAALFFGIHFYDLAEAANTMDVKNNFIQAPIVTPKETMAAVLARISDCESGNGTKGSAHQFNKDGSIVMHQNSNGSIDIGYMQINLTMAHINEAASLKMDLTTEEGNKAFGEWIYENEGTSPWSSSSRCWNI